MTTHSPETLALLRRTVTKNLTDDQHQLFVRAHEQTGLDPFGRFLYVARERGKFRIESTIDGFRLTAERTGKYAGQIGPHWCGADGAWKSIWTSKEPPVAARVGILRSDFQKPIWGKALYSEFVQLENGRPTEFWDKMVTNQLAKCAEAAGFRKAFPERFSGLYTSDEMAQAGEMAGARNGAPHADAMSASGIFSPAKSPETSGISGTAGSAERPAQLTLLNGGSGANPDHGGDSDNPSDPAVPLALQGFVQPDGTVGDRRNVESCFRFLEGELEAALDEPGRELFRYIHWKLPRVFKSKQALNDATLQCWFELWGEIEKAKAQRLAA